MSLTSALLLLIPLVVQAEIDWRTEPKWGFQAVMGTDIQLECNDTNANVAVGDVLTWRTPNDTELFGTMGYNQDKYELINKNTVNGMILKIKNIAVEDHGVYFCQVTRNSVYYTRVSRALNLYEAMYSNKLDKYRNNIMIGGIAAAVFFVPLVGACMMNKFQYESEEEKNEKREMKEKAKQTRLRYMRQLDQQKEDELDIKVPETNDGYTNDVFEQDSTKL